MFTDAHKHDAHRWRMDRYGMALSIGCAIHCALLPLAMTALTASGLAWLAGPELEVAILTATFLLGSVRLVQSYLQHRRVECLLLFLMGLGAFLMAKFGPFAFENAEAVFMTLGGLLVAAAHFRNLRLTATCCPA